MLLDTVDLPLLVTLTVAGGHKVSTKGSLLVLFAHKIFNWTEMKFDILMKQFYLHILRLLMNVIFFNQGKQLLFYWLHQINFTVTWIQT